MFRPDTEHTSTWSPDCRRQPIWRGRGVSKSGMYFHHDDRGILGLTANEVKKAGAQAAADLRSRCPSRVDTEGARVCPHTYRAVMGAAIWI